ncbi:hypothetical protein [Flavobacterium tructae]|uniref:Uncharacterized protein n=1 Tax=Flavobacterium tructae TaxID=1114873 RepID=A0A1S1J3W8_9FLAO|nr:hypothetical protein [Flavobacterium tructae]OHT44470.1 hypothetical protein BHE19_12185 [Flavobacterium tructae]OXB19394.1 hypothetical protein B0A71_12685 [Flavobacterium tructae]
MKQFYLLAFIITSSVIYSQEIATTESGKKVQLNKNGTYKYLSSSKNIESTVLKETDFIKTEEYVKFKNQEIYVLNGDEKPVLTSFSFGSDFNRFSSLSIEQINSMISTANIKTMFQMKNRRTYVPKKISFFFVEKDSTWMINISYIASNDYGGQKDGSAYSTFTDIGAFKDLMIL